MIEGKFRRAGLRALTTALLSLAALLAVNSVALAEVGSDSNDAKAPGKRGEVADLVRAHGPDRTDLRHPGGGHHHHRHHRGPQGGESPSDPGTPSAGGEQNGSNPGKGTPSKPPIGTKPDPPATEVPVTKPPVGEPPVTTPPVTAPPVGEPPTTTPPAEPPVTTPPTKEPPTTTPPANEPPTTTPPTTTPPAGCTKTTSSVSAAQSAVSSAAPGAVICLASGTYGKITLTGSKAAPGVTLRAATPGGTTVDGVEISGTGLNVAYFVTTDEIEIREGSKEITIEDNKITGGYFGVDACASDSTTCDDVKIIGNKFQGPYGEDGIRANRYHDGDGDGIGLLVEGNEFTGIRENGNHSDCLQAVWTGDNLVFRRNYLHDNRCQGFFVKDQDSLCGSGSSGVCGPVQGIRVEDNLFLRNEEPCASTANGCGQPVILHIFGPYTNTVISHNTVWGDGMTSLLGLRESVAAGTKVEGNAIYRFWTDTDASAAAFQDNTYCRLEGNWPSSRPGSSVECAPAFANPSVDDYRLPSRRGVDWAPAEEHYGP